MRLILVLILNALALLITDYIVPGFDIVDFPSAILASIVLGVINTFIKPVLLFLTIPLTIVTLGLFYFVVNAIVLLIVDWIVPGVTISGFWDAILGALVLSVVSTALSMLLKDLGKKK